MSRHIFLAVPSWSSAAGVVAGGKSRGKKKPSARAAAQDDDDNDDDGDFVTLEDVQRASDELKPDRNLDALSEWQRGVLVAVLLHGFSTGDATVAFEAMFHRLKTMLSKRCMDRELPALTEVRACWMPCAM